MEASATAMPENSTLQAEFDNLGYFDWQMRDQIRLNIALDRQN